MDAPEINIARNKRVRLMMKFRAMLRGSWKTKAKGKHRGVITRTAEAVFDAIMYLAQKYGRVFPSLEREISTGVKISRADKRTGDERWDFMRTRASIAIDPTVVFYLLILM
jgi:hypothetical protein